MRATTWCPKCECQQVSWHYRERTQELGYTSAWSYAYYTCSICTSQICEYTTYKEGDYDIEYFVDNIEYSIVKERQSTCLNRWLVMFRE
jgi:hypothetical protein